MEQARIERKQMQVLADIDEGVYHGKIDATCSYQYYVENVQKILQNIISVLKYRTNKSN